MSHTSLLHEDYFLAEGSLELVRFWFLFSAVFSMVFAGLVLKQEAFTSNLVE
jgi:hypothetical protein